MATQIFKGDREEYIKDPKRLQSYLDSGWTLEPTNGEQTETENEAKSEPTKAEVKTKTKK